MSNYVILFSKTLHGFHLTQSRSQTPCNCLHVMTAPATPLWLHFLLLSPLLTGFCYLGLSDVFSAHQNSFLTAVSLAFPSTRNALLLQTALWSLPHPFRFCSDDNLLAKFSLSTLFTPRSPTLSVLFFPWNLSPYYILQNLLTAFLWLPPLEFHLWNNRYFCIFCSVPLFLVPRTVINT